MINLKKIIVTSCVVALCAGLGACASSKSDDAALAQKTANVKVFRTKTPKCEYREEAYYVSPYKEGTDYAMDEAIVYAKQKAAEIDAEFIIITSTQQTKDGAFLEVTAGSCEIPTDSTAK